MYIATPITTTGTTIGEISTAVSSALPGNSARTRPIEARVPSTIASRVASGDTIRLFISAWRQAGEVANSSYQRSEKPDIGYIRKLSALKDSGTMTRMGRNRKARISPTSPRMPKYHARSTGEA